MYYEYENFTVKETKYIFDDIEHLIDEIKHLIDEINNHFETIKNDNNYISSIKYPGRKDILLFVSHVVYASEELYDGILKVIVECEGKMAIAGKIVKNNDFCSLLRLCYNK